MEADLDKVKRSWEAQIVREKGKHNKQLEEHILQTIQLLQELKELRSAPNG